MIKILFFQVNIHHALWGSSNKLNFQQILFKKKKN